MREQLLIATTNPGKIAEITPHLSHLQIVLVTLKDLPPIPVAPETGRTFEENARTKALYYAAQSGLFTVAEDSGLEIEALGGRPGIESARFGGAEATYAQKFDLIYKMLADAGQPESPARFVCALALARGTD